MKKNQTIILTILGVALVAALILGACQSRNGDSSSQPSSGSSPASSAPVSVPAPIAASDSDEPDSGADSTASAAEPDPNSHAAPSQGPVSGVGEGTGGTQSFTGTIADSGMGKFFIETDSGLTLPIPFQNADISQLADSRPGSRVVVTYTGTIEDGDTSGITVISIATAP